MNKPRPAASLPVRALLQVPGLRRRLAFAIAHDHFEDLHFRMPLGWNLSAPLDHPDAVEAFSETFLGDEYGDLLRDQPLPQRWLDFGAHRGFFSLWVAWERARRGIEGAGEALLIDADPRAQTWFSELQKFNSSLRTFQLLNAAVARPEKGDRVDFAQRPGMGSLHPGDLPVDAEHLVSVPRLRVNDITARLAPPYDLIKVDIEGAEYTLFETMGDLLRQTRQIAVEWHGWGEDAPAAEARLKRAASGLGFGEPVLLRPVRSFETGGGRLTSGTLLYRRKD